MKGIKNENGKKSLHGIRRNGMRRNGIRQKQEDTWWIVGRPQVSVNHWAYYHETDGEVGCYCVSSRRTSRHYALRWVVEGLTTLHGWVLSPEKTSDAALCQSSGGTTLASTGSQRSCVGLAMTCQCQPHRVIKCWPAWCGRILPRWDSVVIWDAGLSCTEETAGMFVYVYV